MASISSDNTNPVNAQLSQSNLQNLRAELLVIKTGVDDLSKSISDLLLSLQRQQKDLLDLQLECQKSLLLLAQLNIDQHRETKLLSLLLQKDKNHYPLTKDKGTSVLNLLAFCLSAFSVAYFSASLFPSFFQWLSSLLL